MRDLLVLKDLTKKFGGVTAAKDVNLNLQGGMRLGIIGPNGAGKTTLFNMITGEIKPTSGTIEFEGEPIHGLKPHQISKKGIGRTFQIVRVFDEISVYDNVLIGAVARKLHFRPTQEQHHHVDEIIELTGLGEYRNVMAENLTVSAKKRVGLATALATKPRLLLLDELMAGLTFVEIDEMLELLRKINGEMGITLVVVEHVMKAVMELCENIVVISSGQKIAEGSPGEITNNKKVVDIYLGEGSK
ncbi:MAG: ABC transporter ATP-binding protein [Deltaproteobacteria bacterium]|nr:MAG: ABC transporter ATP-binding protein [Deltaproteobacteria bacterium]